MKRVITYGTFDLFHIGHLNLIKRAAELGDHLTVAVSTDAFNQEKGKKSIIPYAQRAEIVGNIKGVDSVIPEENWEQKATDIKKHKIDVLVMGDDWSGKFDEFENLCQVVYLQRTSDISSSELKSAIAMFMRIYEGLQ